MSELIVSPSFEAKEIEASPPPTPAINLRKRKRGHTAVEDSQHLFENG